MAVDSTEAPKANGLKAAIDIVISPKEALEQIRVAPTWGWAFLIVVVITVAAYFVMLPAVQHAMVGDLAKAALTNPQLAALSPEQREANTKMALGLTPFFVVLAPVSLLFFCLLQTVIMLVFNALGRGTGGFKFFWASSINISIVYGLGQIVAAIVVLLRGADSFGSNAEVQRAIPSLALLAPGAGPKVLAFLSTINPFAIWSLVLVAMAMTVVGRVPKLQAWLAAVLAFIIPASVAVLFAK
jgi:hypothetical protein